MLVVATMIAGPLATPAAMAQETEEGVETPDTVAPGTGDSADEATAAAAVETTPDDPEEEEDTSSQDAATGEFTLDASGPGSPAVIGQGLAFLTGDRVVWQVREIQPDSPDDASSETATTAVVYQVEGETVIRNDVTGKRALLEPGEAFFLSGGDPYTLMSNTSDSVMWSFEVVGDNEVDDDAFYESPLIEDYDEGVFDLEMIRYVLAPGESADIPVHTGPALILSLSGDVDIEADGIGLLGTGDGQLVAESGTVSNNSDQPVVYAVLAFGAEVDDASAGSSSTAPTPEATDDTADEETTDDTTTDDTATDEAATDETSGDEAASDDSSYEGTGSS